jgi:hypothetical protein
LASLEKKKISGIPYRPHFSLSSSTQQHYSASEIRPHFAQPHSLGKLIKSNASLKSALIPPIV